MRSPEAMAGMPCPVCKTPLAMSDRQGIEIDYCPTCRGIWLDRGELDKIIERSMAAQAPPAASPPRPRPDQSASPWDQRHHGDDARGHGGYYGKKRRKSFLEELFD